MRLTVILLVLMVSVSALVFHWRGHSMSYYVLARSVLVFVALLVVLIAALV